jgi:hypothetical protein
VVEKVKIVTLDYYCARLALPEGEKQWRLKTRLSTERLVYKLLSEFPSTPVRFFVQSFTIDDNGAPLTLVKEETIQLYNDYHVEADPPPPARIGPVRRAEW